MPNALNYYQFRDQNGFTGPDQPGLSPDDAIRRIALTPGATFRPGEFEVLMQMAQQAQAQQGQRDEINQFYDSPDRANEIEMAVSPLEQQGFAQLVQSLRDRSRQAAFARARTGNVGGSVQASQTTKLASQGAQEGARLGAQFNQQRDTLQQALEAARVSELLGTYDVDPAMQAAIQERIHGYGVEGETNSALELLRQQRERMQDYQGDEYSRLLGNSVNIGTNLYQTHQQQGMMDDYQAYLQSLRQRQPTAQQPNFGPGGTY